MVIVEGLCKTFSDPKRGEVRAVEDVSFTARPGRILGLLGVNGAGKTTTLRMLSTVLNPGGGKATVAGHDLAKESQEVRRAIGFVSGSTALYGRLTGKECLEYFARLYGLEGHDLREALARVNEQFKLDGYWNRLCDKLSTGQKQRLSIARALLHQPSVLFFDEPTSGLDVLSSQAVLEFIESCRSEGKTVVLSTHIMSEVERLCDDLVILHEGRVRATGTVQEILSSAGQPRLESAFLQLVGYEREVASR